MKSCWKFVGAVLLLVLLFPHTVISSVSDDLSNSRNSQSHTCLGCVLLVSVIEQLAEVQNSTFQVSMNRFCSFLPEKLFLKTACHLVVKMFGPDIIKLLNRDMNADVVCHTLKFCKQDKGQPLCHLYPPFKEPWKSALEKARRVVKKSPVLKHSRRNFNICSLPVLAKVCKKIKFTIEHSVPLKDADSDKYSIFPARQLDVHHDSNCNGIWGVDPKDGIPYEKKFCEGSQPRGIIVLGDSVGAHFHISPQWITASQMSLKSFFNLPTTLTDELDWPQLSGITGFLECSSRIKEKSIYLHLRERNRCNHRDYQNIARNGASSQNLETFIESLSRNQLLDHPAVAIYAMVGNDVCKRKMTTPEKFYSKVMQTLTFLNSHLPKGSHVILHGLASGNFLWDHLHNRYHPIGQLNKDVTYAQFYSFLSCLQVNPCHGWLSSNKTLRMLTTERAELLSKTLKKIATREKFINFDLFYLKFNFQEVIEEWQRRGGQPWQLIEPVDGFHPSEVALLLLADHLWKKISRQWPQVFGRENPFNNQIKEVFGDQGGH